MADPKPKADTQDTPEQPVSFPAHVWGTLSRVDVADHITTAEVKNDQGRVMYTYEYLTWSWAWAQLMKYFPESTFIILPENNLENETVMVNTSVAVIDDDGNEVVRSMWLPVMNPKNNSIQNPTTRQISDARMRCLVKNLAILGLGLDLWAGGDIPVGAADDPVSESKLELLTGLFEKLGKDGQKGFLAWLDVQGLAEITESQYQRARHQLERKVKELSK